MRLPPEALRDGDSKLEEAAEEIVRSLDLHTLDLGGDERYLKLLERDIYERLVRAAQEIEILPYEKWRSMRDRLEVGR